MSDSGSEEENLLDPGHIRDRTSAVYRRRPQYVAGRAMSQRAMPLDPGPGARTSDATTRIFVGPPYEATQTFANLLPSTHNYEWGGDISMLANVASSRTVDAA